MSDTFYLISNASADIYPNTLTKFTNNFGQNPLSLNPEHNWQIGLEEIFLHPRFPNIPLLPSNAPHIRIYVKSIIAKEAEELQIPLTKFHESMSYIPISLPYKHYTPLSLMEKINKLLPVDLKKIIRFTVTKTKKTHIIWLRSEKEDASEYFILIQFKLAIMLGIIKEHLIKTDGWDSNTAILSNQEYVLYASEKLLKVNAEAKGMTAFSFKEITLKPIIPKVIKVEIDHVQPIAENDTHVCIISRHTINMVNPYLHYVRFDNPLYLTLSSSIINEFTVRLLDQNNQQLKLDVSLPTILKMNLRKYEQSNSEFNIVIDSTKKNVSHPQNRGNDFCITLSPPIHLDDDYMCSINSISYSTYFKTLPIPPKEAYIKATKKVLNEIIEIKVPFNPKNKTFFSIQDVLDVLNENCTIPENHPDAKLMIHPALNSRFAAFVLVTEEQTGMSHVSVLGFPNTVYDLPHELIPVLGQMETETIVNNAESHINEGHTKRWTFTLDAEVKENNLVKCHKREFLHPPDVISLVPQEIFIYCDWINPIQIADTQANLLQIVPVRSDMNNKHKYVTEVMERPTWAQVRTRTLNKLCFKLMRSDGTEIGFQNEKDGVIITLTFKKMSQANNNNVVFF